MQTMNGFMRLSIVNLTLLCIGLIGGLMLVKTSIAMTHTSREMAQSAFNPQESSQAFDKLADVRTLVINEVFKSTEDVP